MREIGRVVEVWRYPVSSVGGETLSSVGVSSAGIDGDRRFGLFDCATGRPAAPEQEPRWRPALHLSATQLDDGFPSIRFPDEGCLPVDDPLLAGRLTAHFGFDADVAAHVAMAGSRFSVIPGRYSPAPLHLVTTASLRALARLGGLAAVDSRRFRPSVLIDTDAEGFVENDWLGTTLTSGAVAVAVSERTRRCGMTLIAQPGLDEEPDVLRGVMRHNGRSLGVYAAPLASGVLAVGDRVYAGA